MSAVKSKPVVIATRPSQLAQWQAHKLQGALQARWPDRTFGIETITTRGDRSLDAPLPQVGGKGLFTQELEAALREGRVDLAVHSLKDLPIDDPPGLWLGAVLAREDARDVFVSRDSASFDELASGAVVGTSSPRRRAQALALRPDLHIEPIRGNVETRVRKVREGNYDGAILAAAGLLRLGMQTEIGAWFSFDQMLPAPGQGALAVECRAHDSDVLHMLQAVDDGDVSRAVTAERAFLAALGGGCSAPVGAYAQVEGDQIHLRALIAALDGSRVVRGEMRGSHAELLGRDLAQDVLRRSDREGIELV